MIDIDLPLILIQTANFLIALLFLNYILIGPIRRIIRKREDNMAQLLSEADDFAKAADEKLNLYEAALRQARAEAVAQRTELKSQGLVAEAKLVEAAAMEAQKSLAAAREDIDADAQAAMSQFQSKVADLARQATAKILA